MKVTYSNSILSRLRLAKISLGIFAIAFCLLAIPASAQTNSPAVTTNKTDRWEATIKAFETADKTNPPPKNAIVFVGSSSIRMWKTLAEDFPDKKVINRGFGGSQIADSVRYADRIILPYKPKAVVFYAGDNDLFAKKTPKQVCEDFKRLVAKLHKKQPDLPIYFLSVKPSPSRWNLKDQIVELNRLVRAYCESQQHLEFVDIYSPMLDANGLPREELFLKDKLHMNEKGYAIWISRLKEHGL
jgi:lysophospholipase L1-like esterase